jgi:redox-sensing transcriptional repressor
MNSLVPNKTIERIIQYRRSLEQLNKEGRIHVFSHELAEQHRGSSAQVRRDLMLIGHSGSTSKGYDVTNLIRTITRTLSDQDGLCAVLVGVGHLGRSILSYFNSGRAKVKIAAAIDTDTEKQGRVISGCPVTAPDQIDGIIKKQNITTAILTVPAAVAQEMADLLTSSGIRGIINFAPVKLHLPPYVHVEQVDITTLLEKTAFMARSKQ